MLDSKTILSLRELTGAGMVDAKKALDETGGDINKAAELLRKKGIVKAAKKSERSTHEGLVHAYIHAGGKIGVLVELLCETDFVARNEQFKELAHDIAMQVAANNPLYLSVEDVPADVVAKEKEMMAAEMASSGKQPAMIEKALAGRLQKYYSDVCLLNQAFFKDEDLTIEELVKSAIAKIGENIQVKRFVRFSLADSGPSHICESLMK